MWVSGARSAVVLLLRGTPSPGQMAFALALAGGVMLTVSVMEMFLPQLRRPERWFEGAFAAGAGAGAFAALRKFLPEPEYRRYVTNVPGDAGFDPLGLAGASPETFKDMLEAETKHGRVAMLAFVGIVLPEMFHTRIAEWVNLDDLLVDGCVPTLQNGGLTEPEVAAGLGLAFGVRWINPFGQI